MLLWFPRLLSPSLSSFIPVSISSWQPWLYYWRDGVSKCKLSKVCGLHDEKKQKYPFDDTENGLFLAIAAEFNTGFRLKRDVTEQNVIWKTSLSV